MTTSTPSTAAAAAWKTARKAARRAGHFADRAHGGPTDTAAWMAAEAWAERQRQAALALAPEHPFWGALGVLGLARRRHQAQPSAEAAERLQAAVSAAAAAEPPNAFAGAAQRRALEDALRVLGEVQP